jgi:poly-gamma-glutamate synthesis protein (capsule biosynthesis protein)
VLKKIVTACVLVCICFSFTSEVHASEVILSFIGDCTLGENYYSSHFTSYYNKYGPEYFFSGVESVLSKDDLTIANCEGVFTSETARIPKQGERVFWLKGKPEYAEIFKRGSVEVVNLANNHTFDYGQKGYLDTKENLTRYGVDYFGNEEILVKEIKGIKIGFYGLRFSHITAKAIGEKIQELKELGADVIVGNFHVGIEYQYTPTNFQIQTAKQSIRLGTDIVIQHHPHVVQDAVWYREKVIAYSLGNFCFGGNANPKDKRSIILQVKINTGNLDLSAEAIPVLISGESNINDYRPVLLEDASS